MIKINAQIPANAAAIVPSDTAQAFGIALYVGGDGNVTLRPEAASADVVFNGLKAGTILPIRFAAVRATGTTATGLVRMF